MIDLSEKVIVFLNHLEDVLDEENYQRIRSDLWNQLTQDAYKNRQEKESAQ